MNSYSFILPKKECKKGFIIFEHTNQHLASNFANTSLSIDLVAPLISDKVGMIFVQHSRKKTNEYSK